MAVSVVYDAEGFDNVSSSALLQTKGWIVSGTAPTFTTGRLGRGQCVILGGGNTIITKSVGINATPGTTRCDVFNIRFNSGLTGTANNPYIMQAAGASAVRLRFDATNHLVLINASGTVLGTGTTALAAATDYHIGIKAFANGASGSVALWLNGVVEIASVTANIGSAALDGVNFNGANLGGIRIDDFVVLDDYPGDVEVFTGFGTADGADTAWTPNSGTSHYTRTNEASGTFPDGDTTYIEDSTAGHRDTQTMTAFPSGTTTVYGVVVDAYARKTDSGTRTLKAVVRQSATDYDHATAIGLGTGYSTARWMYSINDPAGSPWTPSTAGGDEYGVRVD